MKFSSLIRRERPAILVIAIGLIIYVGFIIAGNASPISALGGVSGSAIVFLLCKWPRTQKYMLSVDAPVWFTQEQLDEHCRSFGQQSAPSELHAVIAVQALEVIAPAAADFFQARKIGMQVLIPDAVADAYVGKHGAEGQKVIDMLRGSVPL